MNVMTPINEALLNNAPFTDLEIGRFDECIRLLDLTYDDEEIWLQAMDDLQADWQKRGNAAYIDLIRKLSNGNSTTPH